VQAFGGGPGGGGAFLIGPLMFRFSIGPAPEGLPSGLVLMLRGLKETYGAGLERLEKKKTPRRP